MLVLRVFEFIIRYNNAVDNKYSLKTEGFLQKSPSDILKTVVRCADIDIAKSVILPSLQFVQNLARIQSPNASGSVLVGDAVSLPSTRINHWMNTNRRELRIPFSARMSSSSARGAYQNSSWISRVPLRYCTIARGSPVSTKQVRSRVATHPQTKGDEVCIGSSRTRETLSTGSNTW